MVIYKTNHVYVYEGKEYIMLPAIPPFVHRK